MAYINTRIILFFSMLFFISCSNSDSPVAPVDPVVPQPNRAVNLTHFNNLYKEIDFKGKKAGFIYIYSNYPTYEPVTSIEESGITCVDDVARAIIVLSEYIKVYGSDADSLDKIKKYTEFILAMQNENGYFNNFIYADYSINTTYVTSVANLNWWSLRALVGLETAYPLLKSDADITNRISQSVTKLLSNIKRDLPMTSLTTETVNGIEMPTWLPLKYASDQSALLIIGLLKNYERTSNSGDLTMIDALAKGIMIMQKGDATHYPYNAFMSYNNQWHAYGNDQSNALLKAGVALNKQEYIDSALKEVDNFYPKLVQSGYAEEYFIQANGDNFSEISRKKYAQIAYGIRPMVSAAAEAYRYSKNSSHLILAKNIAAWLSGSNDAGQPMYIHETGICFDGIVNAGQVNKNSGAESTIEALLILLEMEKLK